MNTVSEAYLKSNYLQYCTNCKEDDVLPETYEDWRTWFILTFNVIVVPSES